MVHLMINTLNIKVEVMKIHQSNNILKGLDNIFSINKLKKSRKGKIQVTS